MDFELNDKVATATGGSLGIGRAAAAALVVDAGQIVTGPNRSEAGLGLSAALTNTRSVCAHPPLAPCARTPD
jgi:NAD(P)-dependent dehydrogenase (short-subunit alcohol dehydrogenase family)